jgi:predicted DNA-binding transcriptional regulator AlpA
MAQITLQRTVRRGRTGSQSEPDKQRREADRPQRPASPTPPALDPLLDENQVAQVLNISVRTLQGWRVRGGGPRYVKLGGAVRYRRSEVKQHILDSLRGSTSETASRSHG